MKNKFLKLSLLLLAFVTVFISCKDDDDSDVNPVFEADRTEQQAKDKDSLLAYLSTHYYNASFFETGINHKYSDIIITELPKDDNGNYLELPDPENNTLLIDAVSTKTTVYLETNYEYYILKLNQGGGESPRFTDMVRVRYEGSSVINGNVFDSAVTPYDQNLQGDGFSVNGAIRAWQLVMPEFSAIADGDFTLVNGTVEFNDFGLGVMFIPSGLAYFSGSSTGSSYDNLIFKFDMLQFEVVDHDNDGIPSYIEDLDGDLSISNDDTNGNLFPNFVDNNDDGDDVLTIDELIANQHQFNVGEAEPVLADNEYERSRSESNGVVTIKTVTVVDSNGDGVPDYLDENIAIDYNN